MRVDNERGFKALDLVVTICVLGILSAIAIPNFVSLERRAREGGVKTNMHTLQIAIEDFAAQNDSYYPASSEAPLPDGRTLAKLCPGGQWPVNPFTRGPSVVDFNADPTAGSQGELAINPASGSTYAVKGNDMSGVILPMVLSPGH